MTCEVTLHRRVLRSLRTVHPKHCQRILARFRSLREVPRPHDCIKLKSPLEGYRIRIGEYRVLYTIDDDAHSVQVYLLIQRGEGYPE